jgi:arylsulfatase A-like enzyme
MKMKQIVISIFLLMAVVSCRPSSTSAPIAIRLVDLYKSSSVEGGSPKKVAVPPEAQWRFDEDSLDSAVGKFPETNGWEAGPGVIDFNVQNGVLTGKSTTYFPLIHLNRTSGLDNRDLLHAIEIRMRVSEGTELSLTYDDSEKMLDMKEVLENAKGNPWEVKTKLIPGQKIETYTLKDPRPPASADIRHLLIRPTDIQGATFEIESIRLIFRKEYLAGIPSGVRWEGLSEIYHETIVSHAPEKISFATALPDRPWLDLSLGTLENEPVTFRAVVRDQTGEVELMEQTLTTPSRWEPVQLDLSKYANRQVTLLFSLQSANPGALGFWGSPVIRSSGAMPKTASAKIATLPPEGVILIMADTLRQDHLDVYGYNRPTAPNIRRLATEGTLFKDCVSQATWTKVAAPSLFTSLYPTSHGVKDFSDRLPASATTIAEVFHDAGYATVSMSSILFTGAFTNLHQGFDELHEDSSLPDRKSSKTARVYVDRLLPWLEVHREVPFFVFLHISDPHDPYKPYPPYDTMWADPTKNTEHEQEMEEVRRKISDPLLKRFGMPTREELERAGFDPDDYVTQDRDWYDGSIRAMDAEIGRLMERLQTLGLDQKTLVIFIGDHGEEFLEHGRTFHGQSVYGELTNVPLILWGPGRIPKGRTVNQTVETIDVMPTVLELSRLPVPTAAQGKSFLPFVKSAGKSNGAEAGTSSWNRPAISEKAITTQAFGAPPPRKTESFSIVMDGWKLIHNTKNAEGKPEFELYEVRIDPLNLSDVSSTHPDIVQRLSKELDAWRRFAQANRLKPDTEASKELTEEQLERMRSLGYISN